MTSFSLSNYAQVILDGSFFVERFPEEIATELNEDTLYIAPSFFEECAAYKLHMTEHQREVFEYNLGVLGKVISRKKRRNKLTYADDLWSNLREISRAGRIRALLITSNLLLIQKVVLRQLKVDVYNLHELKFMPYTSFPQLQQAYSCKIDHQREWDEVSGEEKLKDSLDVYNENGWMCFLEVQKDTNTIEGLESRIYTEDDSPDRLVKVFKRMYRTAAKLENVAALQKLNEEKLQCSWAAFPLAQIYRDPRREQPLGFYMRKYEGYRTLDNEAHIDKRSEKRFSEVLEWCTMLAAQIAYLGVFGIYVTDYTEKNFLIAPDAVPDRHIIMVDTDSFCQGSYYGGRIREEWGSWKLLTIPSQDKIHVDNKADTIDLALRMLYAELFSIFSMGQMPIIDDRFVKLTAEGEEYFSDNGILRFVFPGGMWELLESVFQSNKLPSVDGLIYELRYIKKDGAAGDLELTYGQIKERFSDGRAWSVNGLADAEEDGDPEQDDHYDPAQDDGDDAAQEPPPVSESRYRRKIRKVDRRNHFAHPRLMGAVIEPQPQAVAGWTEEKKPSFRFVRRADATAWKEEQRKDRIKASRLGSWLQTLLPVLLIAFLVWLCFFSEIDLIFRIREMVTNFFSDIAQWWQDSVQPLSGRFRAGDNIPFLRDIMDAIRF